MVFQFTAPQLAKALTQFEDEPWVWLWELIVDRTPSFVNVFHVTAHDGPIDYDRQDGTGLFTYKPFPLTHGTIKANTKTDLISVDLQVGNVTQDITRRILTDTSEGFIDFPATLVITAPDLLAEPPAIQIDFTIDSIGMTNEAAVFNLRSPNYYRRQAPQFPYQQFRCRHGFKSPECAYLGPETLCSKLIGRCVEIGEEERSRGVPVLHPRNFGSTPGILRRA